MDTNRPPVTREEVLPRLIPILYPKRAKALLSRNRVVWMPFLDLCEAAAVLRGKRAVLLRRAEMPEDLPQDAETLLRRAEANALTLMPPVTQPIASLLPQEVPQPEEGGLLVITNRSRCRGASAVCCPGVLEDVAARLGEGFYLLPSSIHEMIAVPESLAKDPEELSRMVREINRTVVEPEEVLSDAVYRYTAGSHALRIAGSP